MMERIIHIEWKGPFKQSELGQLKDSRRDYGLYQVYACHSVYGSGTLVYIGKAQDQTFGQRLEQHKWDTGSERDPSRLEFYVGRLKGVQPITQIDWSNDISVAEAMLIHEHAPSYNGQYAMYPSLNQYGKNTRVINFGAIRSLHRELSGYTGTEAGKLAISSPVYERPEPIPCPAAVHDGNCKVTPVVAENYPSG